MCIFKLGSLWFTNERFLETRKIIWFNDIVGFFFFSLEKRLNEECVVIMAKLLLNLISIENFDVFGFDFCLLPNGELNPKHGLTMGIQEE